MVDRSEILHFKKRLKRGNFTAVWKKASQVFSLTTGLLLVLTLAACSAPYRTSSQTTKIAGSRANDTPVPGIQLSGLTPTIPLASPSARVTPSPSATVTPLPLPTSTPDPYEDLRIDYLAGRSYGEGQIQVEETLAVNKTFSQTLISYPSDGLKIYGFMNTPRRGSPPYPVVIALHGYIDPGVYNTLDYTTRYADALASVGYLVLHPNLRGYPPSDSGDNLLRVGMAVDVLNLIALVKEWGGKPGPLQSADPGAIGIWGHSMGGGIATHVITVNSDVRAAVLYAAMSGDERQNFEAINGWSGGQRGNEELAVPVEELTSISPINYLDRIHAAVSIHHGLSDELVPLEWSLDLCDRLQKLGKPVECFTYPGETHTFYGNGDQLLIQRTVEFFNRILRGN